MTEAIGWASSVILVLTIARQVQKQWVSRRTEGVSRYLFLGQTAASVGFTLYSWLLRNWVFVVTNGLLLLSGLVGYGIYLRNRRRERSQRRRESTEAQHAPDGGQPSLDRPGQRL